MLIVDYEIVNDKSVNENKVCVNALLLCSLKRNIFKVVE